MFLLVSYETPAQEFIKALAWNPEISVAVGVSMVPISYPPYSPASRVAQDGACTEKMAAAITMPNIIFFMKQILLNKIIRISITNADTNKIGIVCIMHNIDIVTNDQKYYFSFLFNVFVHLLPVAGRTKGQI